MLFNSIDFGIFLPVVAVLYWTVFNRYGVRLRNAFLLACSWFFYGMWDWRFLGLLIFSSTMDYTLGWLIGRTDVNDRRKRKALLVVSLVVNLGILGFFKYANFFIDSIDGLFTIFGMELSLKTLNIILPVGISFYTFQSLSYIIDVYRGKISPSRDIIAFLTFISFFPQLVAGPIERASHLLPQFDDLKKFDYDKVREGLVEVFVGLIKKMVIADRLAVYVDSVFQEAAAGSSTQILGFPSVLALIFFAFQLYIDFSAYSQIAIGTAKILGFSLCTNFRRPYLSSSFNNFWERWHISLSQWMRDYIFIPLGGSREGRRRTVRNLLIVFAVSGLWHGASWNFVIWGLINGLFVILLDPLLARWKVRGVLASIIVFCLWTFSLVFFRAEGIDAAWTMIRSLGLGHIGQISGFGLAWNELTFTLVLLAVLMCFEYVVERLEKRGKNIMDIMVFSRPGWLRWAVYLVLVFTIILFGVYATNNDNSFIYFQF